MNNEATLICPLLSMGKDRDHRHPCLGNRCAWWDCTVCAVIGLSGDILEVSASLDALVHQKKEENTHD